MHLHSPKVKQIVNINLQWFQDMPTKVKIIGLVSVMVSLLIVVGCVGYYGMNNLYQEQLLPVVWLNEVRSDLRAVEALNMEIIHPNTSKARAFNLQLEMTQRINDADLLLEKYEKKNMSEYEAEKYNKAKEELQIYKTNWETIVKLLSEQQLNEAYITSIRNASPHISAVNILLSDLIYYNEEEAKEVSGFANHIMLIITVFSVLVASVLGRFTAKLIVNPLRAMILEVQKISDGNLAVKEFNTISKDEIGQISKAFNDMAKNLRELVRQVAQSIETVSASSEELTASAEQSAQVANQVASSLTEVAQGAEKQQSLVNSTTEIVGQISNKINQVTENATVVSDSAKKTEKMANDGGQAVEQVINQMSVIEQKTNATADVIGELEEKSKQIGQIVGAISNIAGQTNLLALNAAIEAARAGEIGRGFAVVADEVRELAEQSNGAAKQIANLIGEVQQKTNNAVAFMKESKKEVDIGTDVVVAAGRSFREILKMIREISEQIHQIYATINEVHRGSQQIVSAVKEIDKESRSSAGQAQAVSTATEEQSAAIEEIASSSQALSKMAEELQTAIRKFTI